MGLAERSVGQIADLLRDAKDGGPKACLLIGAGASKTAGIGLADDFVRQIEQRYPEIYRETCSRAGEGKQPGYADCMAALTPAKQVQLVRADIDQAKINWAHIGIARLEAAEIIDSILTPNFDPLASRACALFHRFPAIYDLAGLRDDSADHIDFDRSYVKGSAIFHLHGQHTGFLLLNTEDKLRRQAKRIRPVLDATMKGKPVIIAGYSGANDPLVEEIAALAPFNHGLFWVVHDGNDPAPSVTKQLLSLPNCYLVRNMPADRFFTDLANALKLEAPKFMFNPFEHMLGVLGTIECFSRDGGSPQDNLLARAKTQLQSAATDIGPGSLSRSISELMSEGRYQEVWQRYGDSVEELAESDKEQVAWAAVELGNGLSDKAKESEPEIGAALIKEAEEKFSAALSLAPEMPAALNNWGVAILNGIQFLSDSEVRAEFDRAQDKFVSVLKFAPSDCTALNNLAILFSNLARSKSGEEAGILFSKAEDAFERSLSIEPANDMTLLGLGNVLADHALLLTGHAADVLFERAIEAYSSAFAINPANHKLLTNWGATLGDQANMKHGSEASDLLSRAGEKFAAAVAAGAGAETYNNWATVLWREANIRGGDAASELIARADEKFEKAFSLDTKQHKTLCGWGTMLVEQATSRSESERGAFLERAAEKLSMAEALAPGTGSYNLACIRALLGDAAQAADLIRAAHASGQLPDCEHVRSDRDFESVRDTPEFQSALADIGCGLQGDGHG